MRCSLRFHDYFVVLICAFIFPFAVAEGSPKELTPEQKGSLEERFQKYQDDQTRKQQRDHQRAETYTENTNRENFAGWGGILFYCHHAGKESDQTLNRICERSYINANFLAASAKINIEKAKSLSDVRQESVGGDRLILMIDLSATKPAAAVSVSLKAYTFFSGPVEKLDDSKEHVQTRTSNRSGDLIFWERGAIGASSGAGQDLVSPLSEAIEGMLKQFFADYLNAQR